VGLKPYRARVTKPSRPATGTALGTPTLEPGPADRLLGRRYGATTLGTFALVFLAAFEALAVTTIMPTVSRDLDGVPLYALSFAAPLASGVVAMVAVGMWSDRRDAVRPLVASVALFGVGLVACGLAPSMSALVVGRLLQGLGGGGLSVALYVLVGVVYPDALRPQVLAGFAAAWVLPSLFGPAVAAAVADQVGWRWVFLGAVALAGAALALCYPALRVRPGPAPDAGRPRPDPGPATWSLLGWSVLAASAVLGVSLGGSEHRGGVLLATTSAVVVGWAVRPLLPAGTLRGVRGLPSTVLTRGALAASFFAAEAYLPFVLQDHWRFTPGRAGLSLTTAGVVWAGASQVQGRLGARLGHVRAMVIGSLLLLVGMTTSLVCVVAHLPAYLLIAGYGVAAAGMGLSYPRTTVAMLGASSAADRGFNSSALLIADALGGALALAVGGIAFTTIERLGLGDPFVACFGVALGCAVAASVAASRTAQTQGRV
jgi:MFS family permease